MVILFVERIRFPEKKEGRKSFLFAVALSSPAHPLFNRQQVLVIRA